MKLFNRIYGGFEKFTRDTPLTVTGWVILLILISVPLMLGTAYAGYQFNSELIRLQSRTNGMDHTTNYQLLHRGEKNE